MFTQLGNISATRGIADDTAKDPIFAAEVQKAFRRYQREDWGELDPEDKELNREALEYGERILAAYNTKRGKIWIITEWDRSATTVLYPSEY